MLIPFGVEDNEYTVSHRAPIYQVYQPAGARTCGFSALIYVLQTLEQLPPAWGGLSQDDLLKCVIQEAMRYPSVVTHMGEVFCPETFLEFITSMVPALNCRVRDWVPLYQIGQEDLESTITRDIIHVINREGIVMVPFNVRDNGQPSPVPLDGGAHWCAIVGHGTGTPSGISFLVKQAGREYRMDAFDLIHSNAYIGSYPLNRAGTHTDRCYETLLPNGFHVQHLFTKAEAEEVKQLNKKMIYFFP